MKISTFVIRLQTILKTTYETIEGDLKTMLLKIPMVVKVCAKKLTNLRTDDLTQAINDMNFYSSIRKKMQKNNSELISLLQNPSLRNEAISIVDVLKMSLKRETSVGSFTQDDKNLIATSQPG